jgi:hypothetical protein
VESERERINGKGSRKSESERERIKEERKCKRER